MALVNALGAITLETTQQQVLSQLQSGTLVLNQLMPKKYDDIALSYTGTDLTGVVYKSLGVTVATLTLTYSSGNLTHIVRT